MYLIAAFLQWLSQYLGAPDLITYSLPHCLQLNFLALLPASKQLKEQYFPIPIRGSHSPHVTHLGLFFTDLLMLFASPPITLLFFVWSSGGELRSAMFPVEHLLRRFGVLIDSRQLWLYLLELGYWELLV